jgi:hypothetical protein
MISIFNDLAELNIPVYAEGDAPENLPDKYFTYNEDYTEGNLYADNNEKEIRYEFTLSYYTKDADTIYSGLISAMNLLKSKGYIVSGVGYANKTYRDTWFSRQADIKKIEYLEV